MKKFLLLFTAAACVGLASCSETLSEEDKQLEEIQKKFDFSEVNTEGLEISEIHEFNGDFSSISPYSAIFEEVYTDLVAVIGEIDNCRWLGLFDRESGELKYQYTDSDHPKSYSAYGVEYKYEVGDIVGIHFENNCGAIAVQYINTQNWIGRFDLITFDESQKTHRTTIADNRIPNRYDQIRAMRWSSNTIYLGFLPIIYDISENKILCNIKHNTFYNFAEKKDFVSSLNPLHFWSMYYDDGNIIELSLKDSFSNNNIKITELQCTYDTFIKTEKEIELFDPYTGDSSKAPRYSYEYKTKTEDYALVVVTQTQYDGSKRSKIVEIRLIGDDLKVEIQ